MSEYGYYSIPRSLRRDYENENLSLEYRHIFDTILDYMAFADTPMNNSGLNIIVKPFQLLVARSDLLEWCNKGFRSEKKISESMLVRALKLFIKLGWLTSNNFKKSHLPQGESEYIENQDFSSIKKMPPRGDLSKNVNNNFKNRGKNGESQKSNIKPNRMKCLYTVIREDVLKTREHQTEHEANIKRTSIEQQNKKEKKEEESLKNVKKENLLECSLVHNSKLEAKKPVESCKQDEHSLEDSLSKKIQYFIFHLSDYRFPDGSALKGSTRIAFEKYTDQNQEKLIANWILCETRWDDGYTPDDGNYEKMLQGYFKNDYAKLEEYKNQNDMYARWMKKTHDLHDMKIMKTVIKIGDTSISKELPPKTIEDYIANYLERITYANK